MPVLHTQIVCLAFAARALNDRLPVNAADVNLITHNPPDTFSFVLLQYAWSVPSAFCHRYSDCSSCIARASQTLSAPLAASVRALDPSMRSHRNLLPTGSSFELDLRTIDYDIEVVVVFTTHTAFKLIGKPFNRVAHIAIASVIKPA